MLFVICAKKRLMNGRLETSKKWTAFPSEYLAQISNVFNEAFERDLQGAHLVIEGRIFSQEICLRVGFREGHSLRQNNFEISADFDPARENVLEKIYLCIDGAAALMSSYFEGRPSESLPITWKPFSFDQKTLYFQFSTINTDLEAEADRLLGLDEQTRLFNDESGEDNSGSGEPEIVH